MKIFNSLFNDKNDRAQLLLVGSIVVAVSFVGLVIILNSVLVAQNLEGQGTTPEIDRSDRLTDSLQTEYGNGIDRINADEDYTSATALEQETESIINNGNEQVQRQYAEQRGTVPSIQTDDITIGEYIIDNDPDTNFNSYNELTGNDWIIATGTDEYRQFETRIDVNSLPELSENPSSDDLSNESFYIMTSADTSSDVQLIYIYRTNTDGNVQVSTSEATIDGATPFSFTGASEPEHVYNNNDQTIEIDTTKGEIQGWDSFDFANGEDSSSYTIGYGNAEKAEGVFRLTSNGATYPSTSENTDGIYSAQTTINYQTNSYSQNQQVTIEPGSIDSGSTTNSPNFGLETQKENPPLEFEGSND